MERFLHRFNALGAVAFCLLAYPGIFSRLSNDGKQSPASFLSLYLSWHSLVRVLQLFRPGQPIRPGANTLKPDAA